jgi:hypothetical protein
MVISCYKYHDGRRKCSDVYSEDASTRKLAALSSIQTALADRFSALLPDLLAYYQDAKR